MVEHASESVPGSIHDLTLLRQTDLLSKLADDEAVMMDKGYDGIAADRPGKKTVPAVQSQAQPSTD